jgi:hypothetical protein
VLVIVRRFEHDALVLEHLEQARLHRRVHLADLVDEQHAAVRLGHQAQPRFGDATLGEVVPRALVDRIVDAAEQRVRRLAVIPAQRRPGRLDERRVGGERRAWTRFCQLEREPRDGRLADAGRPVEDHVLGIRRGQLRQQRLDRGFLADDLVQRLGAQDIERGAREPAAVEPFEVGQPLFRRRRLRAGLLAQRLEAQLLEVLLVALDHLDVDPRLELIADGALRDQIRQPVLDLRDGLAVLRLGRACLEGRVLEDQPLQRQQAIGHRLRAHLLERAEFARAHDDLLGPQRVGQDVVERCDLATQLLISAQSHATSARRPV